MTVSRSFARYRFGAALTLAAVAAQLPLGLLLGHDSYQVFLATSAVAAIRGGTRNGAFSLGLSVFAKFAFLLLPGYPGHGNMGLFLYRMTTFMAVGAALCWIGGAVHEAEQRQRELLARARLLTGLLPICAACKRIRDDRGRWCDLEGYISGHSDAQFSHGYCPGCAARAMADINAM